MRRITDQMIRERDQWLALVSDLTGVEQQAIMGKSRVEGTAMARHLLCWALHTLRGYSYPMVGIMLGRNPSTVTHSNNVIEYDFHSKQMRLVIDQLKQYNHEKS